jgi:tetratricopeptide (TPR) repeat protein
MKKMNVVLIVVCYCLLSAFPFSTSAELNQYKYFYRGKRYYNLGEYDKAIHDFTRAIELESNYVFAYAERGLAWEKKGFHDKALADFTKALEINPQYVKAIKYRAYTLQEIGEYAKAIEDYNRAIEINPEDSEAFYQIGSIYCKQKNKEDALSFLEFAFKNGFQDFETIENDPVWEGIKESDEFKELIQKYKKSANL